MYIFSEVCTDFDVEWIPRNGIVWLKQMHFYLSHILLKSNSQSEYISRNNVLKCHEAALPLSDKHSDNENLWLIIISIQIPWQRG